MSVPKTTLWAMDDHTRAKHEILRRYLEGWLPIMTSYNGRIIYLDGFAGPGEYDKGQPGSPLIAIDTFLNHTYSPVRTKEVQFFFIEQDHARYEHLKQLLARKVLPTTASCKIEEGLFDETMTELLNQLESQQLRLAPTFAFIDPFGYSHTPMSTIKKLMSHTSCEVLITFMYEEINRFLNADYTNKEAQYDALFGTTEWRTITQKAATAQERRDKLHSLYQDQLKKAAGIHYVRSFCMRNQHNATDYFLFFGTNSLLGMEKMKQAMWKVDTSGTYEFSDFSNPYQPWLLSHADDSVLQHTLSNHFKGQTVSVKAVRKYVITETPFYKFKTEALKPLESAGKINVISSNPKRRKGYFPDEKTEIRFL